LRFLVAAAIAAATFVDAPGLSAQTPSPWIGVWKVDLAKSSYDPKAPPFARQICTIAPFDDGFRISYDIVAIRGGVTHLEWVGKFDGGDDSVEGMDSVMTNAYKRVDDQTYDIVVKIEGQPAGTARSALSADGKTITTLTGKTRTVFEKQ
jgi:hypothetical protein